MFRIDFAHLDLMDALDLAILIEAEAQQRYLQFAEQLGETGMGSAGDIFGSMAINEAKHGVELYKRRKELFGEAPMRVSRDDIFDVEAPEEGAPRWDMSPKKALELALASEQKAFSFYDEALAHVTNEEVKALFTELRDEETEHVGMVEKALAGLPAGADIDLTDEDL